ncbi:MAG: hypothetical protein HRT81_15660 [Henriciella sp.]|nr:hypothetical protein [Henriciella sp.]
MEISRLVEQIELKVVDSDADREHVRDLRFTGYKNVFDSPEDTWDEWDDKSGTHILLAEDASGAPIGTVRVIDSRIGLTEADTYTDAHRKQFPEETSFVEGARLVARGSVDIKKIVVQAALWKATFLYASEKGVDKILVWSKRGPDRGYKSLQFEEISGGEFSHPSLGNKPHKTYCLDTKQSRQIFFAMDHPLKEFFFLDHHPSLMWFE